MSSLAVLHVWGVPARRLPFAVARQALDRRPVRAAAGLTFAKHLGTGRGETFTPRDADPRHWALLTVWHDAADAEAFEASPVVRRWGRRSDERLRLLLAPLASRGRWSGLEPFAARPLRHAGAVAALTRARLAAGKATAFWRAVPPVVAELHAAPGLRLAFGIGEAPVGVPGTFSVWDSVAALERFAGAMPAHADAVRRTTAEGWYAEELFARFAVLDATGTHRGRSVAGA